MKAALLGREEDSGASVDLEQSEQTTCSRSGRIPQAASLFFLLGCAILVSLAPPTAVIYGQGANFVGVPGPLKVDELSGLGKFLREQHHRLAQWHSGEVKGRDIVTMVAGNEASDADSIISALTYAYLKEEEDLADGIRDRVYVPMVKCNRRHMKLRQETVAILSHAGVDLHDMIHADDETFVPLKHLVEAEDSTFRVILVDHNEADGFMKGLVQGRVAEILDHHMDQQAHVAGKETIAFDSKTGKPTMMSACSVIAERYLGNAVGRQLLKDDDGAVAASLLAVIIIDSKGLGSHATATDKAIAEKLKADISNIESKEHLQFKWLVQKKENPEFWKSATLEENLLYDYKQFGEAGLTCGISATFLDLEALLEKLNDPSQSGAVNEYVKDPAHVDEDAESQSTVFMIMLKKSPFHLAVLSRQPGIREFSVKFLRTPAAKSLNLTPVSGCPNGACPGPVAEVDYYAQDTAIATRKAVGPVCQAMLAAFVKK